MLNKIPNILSPDVVKYLMEMGHGDELIIADGNFPRIGYPNRIARLEGQNVDDVLKAILELMPLDETEPAVSLMDLLEGDTYSPKSWSSFREILLDNHYEKDFIHLNRYDFYDLAKEAYFIITTSDTALYANIIIKKGIIK